MEALLGFVAIIGGYWLFFYLLGRATHGAKAAAKAAVKVARGQGSFTDHFAAEFRGMREFEIRARPTKIDISGSPKEAYEIEVRGLIPVPSRLTLQFVTSLFDLSNQRYDPIICFVDSFQERNTRAYQSRMNVGEISPNQGFLNWVKVAVFFPETLVAPYSGSRTVRVMVRAITQGAETAINRGLHAKETTIYVCGTTDCQLVLQEKGYKELQADRDRARSLTVRIAVAVAAIGGPIPVEKARVIQAWMQRIVHDAEADDKAALKQLLNTSFRDAFEAVRGGRQVGNNLVGQLGQIELRQEHIAALELMTEIVTAGASIDKSEIKAVRDIGEGLGIDYSEVKALSERKMVESGALPVSDDSVEALLGIDSAWPAERIRSHLMAEFVKWNGRLQTLEDGAEKERAQTMIDLIARARAAHAQQ